MAATTKINSKDLIKLFFQLPKEEQIIFFEEIQEKISSSLKKKKISKENSSQKAYNLTIEEVLGKNKGTVPSAENIDDFAKKHAINYEKLEPISKLFEDAPSVKELTKMLTK